MEGERGRVPRARRLWFGTKRRGSAKVGTLNKRDSWRITELFSVGHPADHSRTVLGMRAWSDARTPRVATRAAFLSPFAFATVAQRTRGVASAPGPPPRSAIPVHARSRDPRIGDGDDADRARRSRPSGCGVVASPARQGETRVHLPRRARGPRGVLHHARRGRERRHRRARAPGGVPPPRHPRHARAVPTKGVRGGPRRERSGGVPRVRPARDHHHHPRRRSVRVRTLAARVDRRAVTVRAARRRASAPADDGTGAHQRRRRAGSTLGASGRGGARKPRGETRRREDHSIVPLDNSTTRSFRVQVRGNRRGSTRASRTSTKIDGVLGRRPASTPRRAVFSDERWRRRPGCRRIGRGIEPRRRRRRRRNRRLVPVPRRRLVGSALRRGARGDARWRRG